MGVLPTCMSMFPMCAQWLWIPEDAGSLELELYSAVSHHAHVENLGPLQEEQVLLTSALMRQPPLFTGDTQFSGRGPLSILKFFTLSTFLPRLATGSSEDAAAA
jgi:hypothetical protein